MKLCYWKKHGNRKRMNEVVEGKTFFNPMENHKFAQMFS